MLFRADDIFLGSGGNSPGLDVLRTGEIQRLVDLPAGHSAYAIDLAPQGNALAIGTKTGFLYWLAPTADDAPLALPDPLFQGAPVLSMCFVDGLRLVVSDAAGRCLCWEGPDATRPRLMHSNQGVICALVRLSSDRHAGLSVLGGLFVWNGHGELLDQMSVPAPPPARVQLCCWPAAATVVYPGCNGQLVFADLLRREVSQVAAHQGSFQALAVRGARLITVGHGDDPIKCWRVDGTCERVVAADLRGVIAAAAVHDLPEDLLLLGRTGEVQVCSLSDASRRRSIRAPDDRIYRSLWTADEATRAFLQRQRETEEAQVIAVQIAQRSSRGEDEGVEALHRRLQQLHYRHVSLALRARAAHRHDNVVGELSAYHGLDAMLPAGSAATESLTRRAELSARVWQLQAAYEQYGRLAQSTGDPEAVRLAGEMATRLAAVSSGPHVIEAELPMKTLIQAAEAMGRPIVGRFRLDTWKAFVCSGAVICGEELIAKCSELRAESRWSGLPEGVSQRTHWVSAQATELVELIVFASQQGLGLGVKLVGDGRQTVAQLYVLFDSGPISGDEAVIARNQRCLATVEQVESKETLSMRQLFDIRDMVRTALRRILSKSRWQSQDPLGGRS